MSWGSVIELLEASKFIGSFCTSMKEYLPKYLVVQLLSLAIIKLSSIDRIYRKLHRLNSR